MKKEKSKKHPSIIEVIDEEAKKWGLRIEGKSENYISIWTSPFIGIQLRFWIEIDQLYFDFACRTSSWFYNGERTDLHDTISLFFSIYLKRESICSVTIVNIKNPATYAEYEIYGNFMIPNQIDPGLIHVKSLNRTKLNDLVASLFIFEKFFWLSYNGCPCQSCRERLDYTFDYRWEDIETVDFEKLKSVIGFNDSVNYMERTLPTWIYYRNFNKHTTAIKSPEITDFLNIISDSKTRTINGIDGELIASDNFKHFISHKDKKRINIYFAKFEENKPTIVLLENKIIGLGKDYVLSLDRDCGMDKFKTEREKLRERHNKEFEVLFTPSTLTWQFPIIDNLFEDLIKDLLEREPNVTRVRKLANTREADGGVDLVAEWLVPKESVAPDEDPYLKINVIVQCKAYNSGVGKNDVQDIRDTVESRDYQGFFLAVSSYTKRSLTDHLDKLRTSKKIWVDWWTKSEIEDRLKKHEDLIQKYSSILKFEK